MSGKIIVKVRKGVSKDPRYSYYPEWYLEVKGEDGTITTVSPTFNELADILVKILLHEKKVDLTRKRKPDFEKYMNYLISRIEELEDMDSPFYEDENNDIYFNQK